MPGKSLVDLTGQGNTQAGARTCKAEGKTVPCSSSKGIWSDADQCYLGAAAANPPPPPSGSTKGAWYACTFLPGSVTGIAGYTVWLEQPPAQQVDPAQLAREVLARIALQRIAIGITPSPGHAGVLGLPTYLWVRNPGPRSLGPISDSVTDGAVSVTVTARVARVVWTLGDGTTLTCSGAGTPYEDKYGSQPSPTCGHTYTRPSDGLPGGVFPVSATAVWDVTWTGGGRTGAIPFDVTSRTSIRIAEVQALM